MRLRGQDLSPDALDVLERDPHWTDAIPEWAFFAAIVIALPLLWWYICNHQESAASEDDWFSLIARQEVIVGTMVLSVMAVGYLVIAALRLSGG